MIGHPYIVHVIESIRDKKCVVCGERLYICGEPLYENKILCDKPSCTKAWIEVGFPALHSHEAERE